jgi:hypothetical protein
LTIALAAARSRSMPGPSIDPEVSSTKVTVIGRRGFRIERADADLQVELARVGAFSICGRDAELPWGGAG